MNGIRITRPIDLFGYRQKEDKTEKNQEAKANDN